MMEKKDWLSLFIGVIVFIYGLFPLLHNWGIGPEWFSMGFLQAIGNIIPYLIAGLGFYLMVNSVIEITNSNSIGWMSFMIAILILAIGALKTLSVFGVGPAWFALTFIKGVIFNVIFIVEGLFLMIAAFAMEL